MSNEFKAFIFDWGNVLEIIDRTGFGHEISAKYSIPEDLFRKVKRENILKLDAGEINTDQYLENIGTAFGIKINKQEYCDILFSRYVKLNKELLDVIRKLKRMDYRLIILSNNNPIFYEHMKKSTDFERIFDRIILSFQERMKKPNPLFYQKAFEGSDLKPQQCIYLDDREDMVKVASELGMRGITYTSVEDFLKELESMEIRVA
jgi:putative hydrolase of the HAD superfamily